ncbi:DNA starvation/stationary phase protection protein [Arenibacter sp. S6351L]|jgi:starvation-inducible DNA-binding protein|uniref:Dps family protein n=1 Tax=Arenibacter sp. S6351L TaxID=2926407 RepID=UPI001FF0F174|nr:DNA starvation/stationary phase protection protein [Arenibacter sp. S6351L]MCK0135510.1 DNA starvation/stationary phase protection protein [Arenibacter sp. S6351L]MDX1766753.1 DNA starvation/stationary phase protection protein [Arenibacter troitsensis]|tara:strand:- start:10344 stop:10850 length:507 start_codon:yes stop_codon:yes gene_type:complete
MKTNIGITKENREKVADVLAKLLADEFVLYTKTLGAHWNLEGHDFHTKHLFFEEHYNSIKKTIDSVAERMRKIGSYAPATLEQFLDLTHLTEKSNTGNSSQDYIKMLLGDHDAIIQFIRENISQVEEEFGDVGTADFLTGILQEHEEMAWMLRASISKQTTDKKPLGV